MLAGQSVGLQANQPLVKHVTAAGDAAGTDFDEETTTPTDCTAGVRFLRNGEVRQSADNSLAGYWINLRHSAVGDQYEISASVTSGVNPTSGTVGGAWQALTGTVEWYNSQAVLGTRSTTLSISIRGKNGSTLYTGSYTINATEGA